MLDADRILVLNGGRIRADLPPDRLLVDGPLLRENRLIPPPVLRLCAALGLPMARTPEDLAEMVRKRSETQRGVRG